MRFFGFFSTRGRRVVSQTLLLFSSSVDSFSFSEKKKSRSPKAFSFSFRLSSSSRFRTRPFRESPLSSFRKFCVFDKKEEKRKRNRLVSSSFRREKEKEREKVSPLLPPCSLHRFISPAPLLFSNDEPRTKHDQTRMVSSSRL